MTRSAWILLAALATVGSTVSLTPPPATAGGRVSIGASFGHGGYVHRYPYRHYSAYRSWHPYWHWGLSVGYPYYGWGSWSGHPVGYRVAVRDARLGAVDLNVKPKKAEVYIDGEYVGTARQFDGYPSYLWLRPGSYELALYREGFRTEAREIQVRTGALIDLRIELARGLAERPAPPAPRPALAPERRSSPAESRVESRPDRPAPAAAPAARPEGRDLRAEPSRLHLSLEPLDASVYLDGRLLGSAEELQGLHAGLLVEAGSHLLEVVRPGYQTESLEFDAEPGEEIELVVGLDPLAGDR